jgi:hypothetical protein
MAVRVATAAQHLFVWRRRHSQDIIAEVTPVAGIGSWRVSVWQKAAGKTNADCHFSLLTDAQGAGVTLALITFGHRCDADCGQWQTVEPRPLRAVK